MSLNSKSSTSPPIAGDVDVAKSLPSPPANANSNGNGVFGADAATSREKDVVASTSLPASSTSLPPRPSPNNNAAKEDVLGNGFSPMANGASITEAPESDLREASKPAAPSQIAEIKDHKVEEDVKADLLERIPSEAMDTSEDTPEVDALAKTLPTSDAPNTDNPATLAPETQPSHALQNKQTPDIELPLPKDESEQTKVTSDVTSLPTDSAQSKLIDSGPSSDLPVTSTTTASPTTFEPSSEQQSTTNELTNELTNAIKQQEVTPTISESLSPATIPSNQTAVPDLSKSTQDTEMSEAGPPPTKLSRERDDDVDDEPLAKRTKTEEFKVPEMPASASPAGSGPTETNGAKTEVTEGRRKFLMRGLQTLRRSSNSQWFKTPVDYVALNIPTYPTIVTRPMDLGSMEDKLKSGKYDSVQAFIQDFEQIVTNSLLFNGEAHTVTQTAFKLKTTFDKYMAAMPADDSLDIQKKPVAKTATARREPRVAPPKPAPPASTAPVFALNPEGVPLIRRDSTVQDGRPKREIHPPKNRDMPYSMKPKKKKFQLELRFCQDVLDELYKAKNKPAAGPFEKPVDPVALNIPTYHSIIKKPMDLGTIESKLKQGAYENAKDFEADFRLMVKNCYKFNRPGDYVYNCGKDLENIFDAKWATKGRWIEDHEPPSARPQSDSEEESEESVAEESDEEEDANMALLQKQIAEMSKKLSEIEQKKLTKKPKKPSPKPKKDKKASKKDKAPASGKSKKDKKGKSGRTRYVTFAEKTYITNSIGSLPEKQADEVFTMITKSLPHLAVRKEPHYFLPFPMLTSQF